MKHSVLLSLLLTVSLAANARSPVRPYEEWEATQFVALSGHQPSDYVAPDNNWEILYCLRTPHTPAELRATGVGCTDSQLMLLEVGGLIAEQEGKWKTTIPILDREQTRSLRSFADGVAESVYTANEADFVNLAGTIREAGFGNNVFSLLFSYLLDGRMWTKLVLFEEIENHSTWSGCYWILYEPRDGMKCGTNSYGDQDLILTYTDSRIARGSATMDRYAAEIARYGKVTDDGLITELQPYGMTDSQGNVPIPVIGNMPDAFHGITQKLVDAITTELKANCGDLATRYGIEDEKTAMVVLYHEVMWSLTDRLIRDGIVSVPPILTDGKAYENRLCDVLFFVGGGLMQ